MDQTKYTIRCVGETDYYNGHLELYMQLTAINPKDISYDMYKKFIEKLNDDHMVFVVCDNKKIIGTGTVIIETKLIHNLGKVCHIEDIVVDKEYRSCGIGKMLIDSLVKYGKDKGVYKIILDTSEEISCFYKKCGFVTKGVQMAIYI